MSYFPFNGGKRICFGKTFAEMVLKVVASMLSQTFDFEFVEKERYYRHKLPATMMALSNYPKIPFLLKERKQD